jgi:hypothetical protein
MVLLAIAGVVILLLSLLTANNLKMNGTEVSTEQWKFYLGRDILPDNILYPLLMIRDRVRLDSAAPREQVALKLEYAEERYKTAEELLRRDRGLLAVSTLTKSQKYIISAGYQSLEVAELSKDDIQKVRNAVDHSLFRIDSFSKENPEHNQSIITQLREETRILLLQLDERLSKL